MGAAGGSRLTETGLSVGTPFYMSPEQATGDQQVGPASDTYALAAVLYEMLTGDPPYIGSTAQAVLGKIIQGAPVSATEIRKSVPRNVDAAIRKALEKLPADRFASAQDFAKALADPGFGHGIESVAGLEGGVGRWNRLTAALAATTALFALTTGWALLRPAPQQPVARFESPFLEGQTPTGPWTPTRDGAAIIYVGPGESAGTSQLWIRSWDDLEARPVPGTDGARSSTDGGQIGLSPDGREVAFATGSPGPVRVVPVAGGPSRTVADASYNVAWSDDDWIYFTTEDVALARVRPSGGEAEVLTELSEGEAFHALQRPLPDGRTLLFEVWHSEDGGDAEVWSLDLATRERKMLLAGNNPQYLSSGYLLFGTFDGRLMAVPFDAKSATLAGVATPVLEGLLNEPLRGHVIYSVSEDGGLAYLSGAISRAYQFVWVTRSGLATPIDPSHRIEGLPTNFGWRLSPDETRIAFNSVVDGNDDVRIKHVPDGPEERITFYDNPDVRPFWAPDGRTVTYFSAADIWSARADGSGQPVLVLDDEDGLTQGSWSPDGRSLVFRTAATVAQGIGLRDIMTFRPGIDSAAVPLLASPEFGETGPAISPDGRWLAYTSNETGRDEVFVRPFPDVDSSRLRVSTNGGFGPVWAKGGRELFYVNEELQLVAAQFDPASGTVRTQAPLFTIPFDSSIDPVNNFYDVTADGERFLMGRRQGGTDARMVLVQNWVEELKRLVPN